MSNSRLYHKMDGRVKYIWKEFLGDEDRCFYKDKIFLFLHSGRVHRRAFPVGDLRAAKSGRCGEDGTASV